MRRTGGSRTSWRDLVRNTRGSEIAEFAMILPLLFLVLIGIFWFGQAFRIYGTITIAAREGARAAVAPACATCGANDPTQNAWNAVQSAMLAAHLNPNQLQWPTPLPPVCSCLAGSGTSCSGSPAPPPVGCDIGQNNICVQGVTRSSVSGPASETNIELSTTTTGGAGECGVSVSFQYPYRFWLPFTSLNNQTVNLRAQAQMRAESQ